MPAYTLGLFANMYPAFEGDYRGVFIRQMVQDLESRGVMVKKAVKTSPSVLGYFPFFSRSVSLVRDRDLDLMQAEYIPHSSIIPVYLKRREVPLILKFHGDDARIFPFRNRFTLSLTKLMLKNASHTITSSEEIRRILIGIGACPDRVSTIHSGVDTRFFVKKDKGDSRRLLGLPVSDTIFLFVGRLHPWKGVPELIEVARACPQYHFVFLGPGTVPDHPGNCLFFGTKPHNEIRTWMNAADCFVLPTHTEAIPTSVMEAFACGLPAITTDIGGCPEIVTENENGLLVPVGNIQALLAAVDRMGRHEAEREQMGENARKTVRERFDQRMMTDRLIEVHKEVMGQSHREF